MMENKFKTNDSSRYNVYRVWSWSLAMIAIASFSFSEETDLILPAFGVLTQVWSGAMTCIAGIAHYKDGFPMFRPFQGGTMFVMMQGIGWTLFSFAAAFAFLLLANSPMPRVETMGVAVLGFSANSILNLSLDKLVVVKTISENGSSFSCSSKTKDKIISSPLPRGRKRSSSAGSIAKHIAEETPKQILRVFPYGLVFGFLSFLLCIVVDIFRPSSIRSEYCVYVTAIMTVTGAFATHILIADLESFMPFSGGFEYRLLQAIGWLGVGSVAYSALSMASKISNHWGALTIYGLTQMVSNVIILWSFEFYIVVISNDDEIIQEKEEEGEEKDERKRKDSPPPRRRQISPHRSKRNVMSSCLRDTKRRLSLRFATFSGIIWALQISAILIGIFLADGGVIRTDGVLLRMPLFCQIPIIAAPLAAHIILGGILRRKDGYKVFQPFRGGEVHILLQSFGWLFFAALVMFVAQSKIQDIQEGYWLVPFAITSHVLITMSVLQFQRPRILIKRSDSFVRAVSTISLFIVDLLNLIETNDDESIVRSLILLLLKVPLMCLPFAMFGLYIVAFKGSIRHFLRQWRPFAGPEFFVMCEAIAWTIFVTSFGGNVLILAAHRRRSRSSVSYIVGWCIVIAVGFLFSYLTMRYAAKSLLQSTTKMSRRARQRALSVSVPAEKKHVRVSYDYENYNMTRLMYFIAVSSSVLNSIFVHIQGVMYLRNFEAIQPFRGGSDFVVLQAIGWMLYGVGCALALVFGNLGVASLRLPGLTFFLGLAFYASQLTLMHSLDSFQHHNSMSYTLDDRVGVLLGSLSAMLFLFVDLVVIRFGLPVYMFRVVTAIAWIAAGASVPLSTLILYKSSTSSNRKKEIQPVYYGSFRLFLTHNIRSPIIIIMATALWSFSILLGSILVVSSILNAEYLPRAWTASLAALTHVVSHVTLRSGSSNTSLVWQDVLSLIPFALVSSSFIWISVKLFSNIVLPCLRAFLDNPMQMYARLSRRRKGWISPDGIQAMWNVQLESELRYGPTREFSMDVLRPKCLSKCFVSDVASVQKTPVIYAHGGAHMCVRRGILHHSMTPLARCGLTVYSVEYPLSPEAKYPTAVLAILHAILYVSQFHCTNVNCTIGNQHKGSFPALNPTRNTNCKHCGERLGTNVVNLCGDSAGGSLVSMATAALNNPHLYEEMLKLCVELKLSSHGVECIENVKVSKFPKVERLGLLYGLFDRNTSTTAQQDDDNTFSSFMYGLICRMGIGLIFNLYEGSNSSSSSHVSSSRRSSLMDLKDEDLKKFCSKTLMICGLSDPLLFGNRNANRRLKKLGHCCDLVILPGSHGFHGVPPLWMHYLGSNWRHNALPATIRLAKLFTKNRFQEDLMLKMQAMEASLKDWTPLLVFPFFLLVLPLVLVCSILYSFS